MVPVVVLAIIALAVIKSLMSVVARDEASTLPPWSPDYIAMNDPTVELRVTRDDDVRAFLLPAADTETAEREVVALNDVTSSETTRSETTRSETSPSQTRR